MSYYDATEDYWVKTQNVSGFFKIYDKEVFGSLISSKDILLDIYEKPVREALIDTETGYKTYELFGDKQTNYYLKKLNKFYEDLQQLYQKSPTIDELKELLGRARAKKGMFEGNLIEGELEIGQIAGLIHAIKPAGKIIEETIAEFEMAKKEVLHFN